MHMRMYARLYMLYIYAYVDIHIRVCVLEMLVYTRVYNASKVAHRARHFSIYTSKAGNLSV